MLQKDGFYYKLRVWHRKGKVQCSTLKCGCCNEKVEIGDFQDGLEINGVIASKKEWAKILLPLLKSLDK